jgi:hypothetical protein
MLAYLKHKDDLPIAGVAWVTLNSLFTTVTTADHRKATLLEIAKQGKSKPKYSRLDKTQGMLAMALRGYLDPKSGTYDPEFKNELFSLRPDWVFSGDELRKQDLLKLAESGQERLSSSLHLLQLFLSNAHRYPSDRIPYSFILL